MKPGTSAIFVMDYEGDMDLILPAIRGLGGNGVEDQCGFGTGQADSVNFGGIVKSEK